MRARLLAAAGVAPVALLVAAACGLDQSGLLDVNGDASIDATMGGDGTAPADDAASLEVDGSHDGAFASDDGSNADDDDGEGDAAAIDAGPDAGPCSGVVCNDVCVDASTCETCDGSTLFCASTGRCGSSCTSCTGLPIQCFDCDSNRAHPVATCQPPDASAYCLNGDIYPRYHCGCPDEDAGECPGATQTCSELGILSGDVCRTCGEDNTDMAACKGGGTCDEATAKCN
jgi:hypothetical protein